MVNGTPREKSRACGPASFDAGSEEKPEAHHGGLRGAHRQVFIVVVPSLPIREKSRTLRLIFRQREHCGRRPDEGPEPYQD